MLLSSHLLGEVQEICDRVGVIAGGRLLVESTVAELRGGDRDPARRAEPLDRALAVAMRVGRRRRGRGRRRGAAGVRAGRPAPELARALVAADVDVHELHTVERSLEDVFFDLTRTQLPRGGAGMTAVLTPAVPLARGTRAELLPAAALAGALGAGRRLARC